eukprot:7301145-Alexandrium_andersonii.AAC.1
MAYFWTELQVSNTTWPGYNQVELDSPGDGRPGYDQPDGLARKWGGMLQQLSALARLGNPGCKLRLRLAARNLDTSWVNDLLQPLSLPRRQTPEPPLGIASGMLELRNCLLGDDGE